VGQAARFRFEKWAAAGSNNNAIGDEATVTLASCPNLGQTLRIY
jgi:hypothetical protein